MRESRGGEGRKYTMRRPPRSRATMLNYAADLNPQQLDVVMAGEGPILVIAGAGSGKTHTITYRLARLVEEGVPPESILLLTFTNKAAREMLHRSATLIQGDIRKIWGGTFHHVGNLFLRQHGSLLGFSPNFTILDREDSGDLIADCIQLAGINPKEKHFPKGRVLESLFDFAANTDRSLADALQGQAPYLADRIEDIEKVAARYGERKREIQAVDFADLLTLTRTLLQQHEPVQNALQQRFHYILVDEYQDTNKIQAEIIDALAGRYKNLTVVGDDAQSIYSFRGAYFENIITFPDRYPGARLFRLEANYRSTEPILALANASIKNNKRQFEKKLATTRGGGSLPALVPTRDVLQQADFVVQRILELSDEGVTLSELAVLYRAHYHSMELQMELTRRGVPFEVRSGLRFFEQRHIKDVTSFLRLVKSPADELAWKRALRLLPRVGAVTAGRIWDSLRSQEDPIRCLWERGRQFAPRGGEKLWEIFRGLVGEMAGYKRPVHTSGTTSLPPSEMILLVLDRFYEEYMESNFDNATARAEDVRQMAEFAVQYDSAEAFLSELALMGTIATEVALPGRGDGPEESVVLSSVHQAKGLEWKVVFLIWLSDSRFPLPRALSDLGGEEEERRLFYVGVTRAKDELYLCQPMLESDSYRMGAFSRLSRFVSELPEKLYERWSLEEEVSAGTGEAGSGGNARPADPDEPGGLVYDSGEEF